MIVPVILAGGSGSRLWPLSREGFPKPFISLMGETTLFQQTLLRLKQFSSAAVLPPIIVCAQQHHYTVISQMQAIDMPYSALLLEPVGRNTAGAITVAALAARHYGDDIVLLTMPADLLIDDDKRFVEMIMQAQSLALQGQIITFGVTPDRAHTGYGYIKKGPQIAGPCQAYKIDQFVEKPDVQHAQQYLAEGGYYWNSGMFMFHCTSFLEKMRAIAPDIALAADAAYSRSKQSADVRYLDKTAYQQMPDEPIDTALMEKIDSGLVVPLDVGWSDIGSWLSLYDLDVHKPQRDAAGNLVRGNVVTQAVEHCYLRTRDRLLVAIGVKDQVIVETNDAILVAHKDHVQAGLKSVVKQLKDANYTEAVMHKQAYRPWGSYEVITQGPGFQVKHISVNPGASLSLQLHHKRSEHWVVVSGTAEVTRGDEIFTLQTNQSTYIPVGVKHRMRNVGKIPLQIVEVQSGSYLGEDDIVRFDDEYSRDTESLQTQG